MISVPLVWIGINGILSGGIQLPDLSGYDFKTPALYFFSAVAQTMGALLAISIAILSMSKSPKDFSKPYTYEPYKRLLMKDSHLSGFIRYSAFSTIASIMGILLLLFFGWVIEIYYVLIPFALIVGITATSAIYYLYFFVRYKNQLLSSSYEQLKSYKNENHLFDENSLIDYYELSLLNADIFMRINGYFHVSRIIVESLSENQISKLFNRIYNDMSIHFSGVELNKEMIDIFRIMYSDRIDSCLLDDCQSINIYDIKLVKVFGKRIFYLDTAKVIQKDLINKLKNIKGYKSASIYIIEFVVYLIESLPPLGNDLSIEGLSEIPQHFLFGLSILDLYSKNEEIQLFNIKISKEGSSIETLARLNTYLLGFIMNNYLGGIEHIIEIRMIENDTTMMKIEEFLKKCQNYIDQNSIKIACILDDSIIRHILTNLKVYDIINCIYSKNLNGDNIREHIATCILKCR